MKTKCKYLTRKNIAILLSLIITGAGGTFAVSVPIRSNPFENKSISGIQSRVEIVENFMYDEMVKFIMKNAKKITSDPDDLKRYDIFLCLTYLNKLPDHRKTEDVKAAIDIIVQWNNRNL